MLKENNPPSQPWLATAQASQTPGVQETAKPAISSMNGAQFDQEMGQSATLAELKKMQDPEKFGKARFRFRLYKK